MFRARRSLAVLVALGVVGVIAAAVAANGRQPDTDSVMATVVFSHVEGKTRSCEGVDGEYAEQHVTVTGMSTGDPRLSGKVTFSVYVIVNVENGVGTENGTIKISDAQTGRTKVKARVKDAGVTEIWQGLAFGQVRDRGSGGEATSGTGEIHANYRITFMPNGAAVMQILALRVSRSTRPAPLGGRLRHRGAAAAVRRGRRPSGAAPYSPGSPAPWEVPGGEPSGMHRIGRARWPPSRAAAAVGPWR